MEGEHLHSEILSAESQILNENLTCFATLWASSIMFWAAAVLHSDAQQLRLVDRKGKASTKAASSANGMSTLVWIQELLIIRPQASSSIQHGYLQAVCNGSFWALPHVTKYLPWVALKGRQGWERKPHFYSCDLSSFVLLLLLRLQFFIKRVGKSIFKTVSPPFLTFQGRFKICHMSHKYTVLLYTE